MSLGMRTHALQCGNEYLMPKQSYWLSSPNRFPCSYLTSAFVIWTSAISLITKRCSALTCPDYIGQSHGASAFSWRKTGTYCETGLFKILKLKTFESNALGPEQKSVSQTSRPINFLNLTKNPSHLASQKSTWKAHWHFNDSSVHVFELVLMGLCEVTLKPHCRRNGNNWYTNDLCKHLFPAYKHVRFNHVTKKQ